MLVSGWASVAMKADGQVVEDQQGDVIDPQDLEDAFNAYALGARRGDAMHRKKGVSRLVQYVFTSAELQKAWGLEGTPLPIGAWVTFKVDDPDTWAKVKSGEFTGFSFAGRAKREAAA